jgi:hypothetical protein
MRAPNIVIFFVLVFGVAGILPAVAPGAVALDAGQDATIADARTGLAEQEVDQPSADEVTGSILNNANILQTISAVLFSGPAMLRNLGMPAAFVSVMTLVLGFVIAFDIAEAVTGRDFS